MLKAVATQYVKINLNSEYKTTSLSSLLEFKIDLERRNHPVLENLQLIQIMCSLGPETVMEGGNVTADVRGTQRIVSVNYLFGWPLYNPLRLSKGNFHRELS